jgi:AcrR family transcriptional regulator
MLKGPKDNDIRSMIVRESIRLFLAYGFKGTSVKQITEATGIARGTLYWYFKSKDEIEITIFRKFETELLDKVREAVKNCDGDFAARYRTFHKYSTEFARDNRELCLAYNTLLNEISGTDTEAEKVAKSIHEKFRLIIKDMLDSGKRDGSVGQQVDSNLHAHAILACHVGMLVQWLVAGEAIDARAFVITIRDFILKGISG